MRWLALFAVSFVITVPGYLAGAEEVVLCHQKLEEMAPHTPRLVSLQVIPDMAVFTTHDVDGEKISTLYARSNRDIAELVAQKHHDPALLSREFLAGKKVLDAPSGDGALVHELRKMGIDATGLDIHLTPDQKNSGFFIEADMLNSGLPSNHFDVVISTEGPLSYDARDAAPEALRKMRARTFEELARVTKSAGGIMILTPLTLDSFEFVEDAVPKRTDLIIQRHGEPAPYEFFIILGKIGTP